MSPFWSFFVTFLRIFTIFTLFTMDSQLGATSGFLPTELPILNDLDEAFAADTR